MAEVETKLFPLEVLRDFSNQVFLHFGVPKHAAAQAAEVLAAADLRGIDSHGVARLHSYFDMLTLGRINPRPEIKVLRSTPTTATSAVAYGKIEIARRRGEPIPEGWAVDSEGRDTTDPNAMINGGALLPLGSDRERGGHKGYGLAIMVDVLCGVLSGANWGPFTPPFALRQEIPKRSVGQGIGHFFGAMQIDGFIDRDSFKRQIDDYIRTFRATKPAPGPSRPPLPGAPEREAEISRRKNGIPLVLPVVEELRDIAKQTRIPFE